ncbi:arginase family protein [Halopenitus persicus]|uniref:class II histone deacetylase n=1 Tax=Halopenitus persicus TaxID=1048396 RepID=UPI000BBA8A78|nr:class II histone deacetylase [Halopenitus persicus]
MTADITVYWDDRMLDHEPPRGAFKFPDTPIVATPEVHPDRRERVENVRAMIDHAFDDVAETVSPSRASRTALERVHDPDYLDWLEAFCADGGGRIEDTTTGMNEHTYDAARVSAGAAIAAAGHALDEPSPVSGPEAPLPYALCRPSGHHAQPDCADGFCFLNNAALAAEAALADDGPADVAADRVAIVDWDVHHGNGTQEAFVDREDVLFVSAHNDHGSWHPEYHPQEGSLDEVGTGDGEGYTVNVPLPPGTGNRGYEAVFDRIVEPVVAEFDPDLLLVSAGQDAGPSDMNGRNIVTRAGFREMGARVRRLADETADGALALIQEGGYQPSHLSFATLGVFEGVLDRTVELEGYGTGDPFTFLDEPTDLVEEWIDEAVARHREYWPVE